VIELIQSLEILVAVLVSAALLYRQSDETR